MGQVLGFVILGAIVFWVAQSLIRARLSPGEQPRMPHSMDGIMKSKALEARNRAKSEYRIDLIHDRSSIKDLEKILDDLRNNHLIETYSEQALADECQIWGAYVGEVLRRIRKGKWRKRSKHRGSRPMPFILNRRCEVFPCSWVYRRIKHGTEYSVVDKVREFTENRDNPNYADKNST